MRRILSRVPLASAAAVVIVRALMALRDDGRRAATPPGPTAGPGEGSPVHPARAGVASILLSPVVGFPALWFFALALAQIHLLDVQKPWSTTAWVVIVIVPFAFVAGGLLARTLVRALVAPRPPRMAVTRSPRRILVALLVVSYCELAREFASIGAVPLLSSHVDATRTAVSSGALELFLGGLTVCTIVALSTPTRLLSRAAVPELLLTAVALFGLVLGGGRETVAIPLVAAIVARALLGRPPSLRALLALGLLGAGGFSLIFYLRTGQEVGQAFANDLYGRIVPGTPPPLLAFVPVHFALALNDTVLARVVDTFPHVVEFGRGMYDTFALHSVLPTRSLGTVTRHLAPPWFVATLAGPLWADGGMPVVVVGCMITGAVSSATYWLYHRTLRFSDALLAGYLAALGLFCVYDSIFTQYKDWVFIGAALIAVGRYAERSAAAADPADLRAPVPRRRDARWTIPTATTLAIALLFLAVAVVANRGVRDARRITAAAAASAFDTSRARVVGPRPGVQVLDTAGLPAGTLAGRLATDGESTGSSTIWSFSQRSGRVYVRALTLGGARLIARRAADLGRLPADSQTHYAVARWGPRRQEATFVLRPHGARLAIKVLSIAGRGRMLAHLLTPPIPRSPDSARLLAIATTSGTRPDLVVLDRGPGGATTINVYSGESGFRARIVHGRIPVGFPSQLWSAFVGSVNSMGADLIFATRAAVTPTGQMEVHVLPGPGLYRRFQEQAPVALAARDAASMRFLVAHVGGQPALYGVDARGGRVVLVSLAPFATRRGGS